MLTRTVAMHHVRAALRGAERSGLDVEALLGRAGIPPALLQVERARVSTDRFAQLIKELWLVLDDEFIGTGPAPCPVGAFAMMCHATVHCSRDLRAALRRASEFYALLPSGPRFRLVESGESTVDHRHADGGSDGRMSEARVEFDLPVHEDPDRFRAETLLVVAHRFSGWLIRRRIPLLRVELAYTAPEHVLEYDLLFGAPCRFDAPGTALVFDQALLDEPVLQDEAGIAAFLRRAPQDVLARIDYGSTMATRVRRLLGQSLIGLPRPGASWADQTQLDQIQPAPPRSGPSHRGRSRTGRSQSGQSQRGQSPSGQPQLGQPQPSQLPTGRSRSEQTRTEEPQTGPTQHGALPVGGGILTEGEVAARLSISPQTLRRHLASEGTGFQQLRDQMRRDHAIAALADGRTPIERISAQLGFSEPSAFHRAFKRWTGSTPRAYQPGGGT